MPLRPELRRGALGRGTIGKRPHSHPVAQRCARAARQDVERSARGLQSAHEPLGVRLAGKAPELHGPSMMGRRGSLRSPGRARRRRWRSGGRCGCFKRRLHAVLCPERRNARRARGRRLGGIGRRRRGIRRIACAVRGRARCGSSRRLIRRLGGRRLRGRAGVRLRSCLVSPKIHHHASRGSRRQTRGERRQRRMFRTGQELRHDDHDQCHQNRGPDQAFFEATIHHRSCCVHGVRGGTVYSRSVPAGRRARASSQSRAGATV